MRKADALPLTSEERSQLEAWAKGRTIQARLMERARILLLLAEGAGIRPAAMQLQVGFNTVRRWPIPQNTPWCFRWTKKPRFKPWIGASPGCR